MREPELLDFIYEEIRQCEEYALMNLVTFEAAIRNSRVREILSVLNSASSEQKLDSMLENTYDDYSDFKKDLKENYYVDYHEYTTYVNAKKDFFDANVSSLSPEKKAEMQVSVDKTQAEDIKKTSETKEITTPELVKIYKNRSDYNLHISHKKHASHSHNMDLQLYRPKMAIPHKDSSINIKIPMYHIQPKYLKAYYERLHEKHLNVVKEVKEYYALEELFYDEVDEPKVLADKYAVKFFVWDYVQWWEEDNGPYTPDSTARSLHYEIGNIIGATINDRTGRCSKVEKYLEEMNSLIDGGYKKFYTPS